MQSFDFFDRIYGLNLDEDVEMWEGLKQECREVSIAGRLQRFSAVEHENGYRGNQLSHLAMIEEAKEDGCSNVLILEDDCDFVSNARRKLAKAVEDLQKRDWALFYLGVGWGKKDRFTPDPVGDYLFRLKRGWFIHAYAINLERDDLLEHIQNRREGALKRHNAWDNFYSKEVFPEFECFCAQDLIALQKKRQSQTAEQRLNFVPNNLRWFEYQKAKALD